MNYHSSKGELLALFYGLTAFEHLLKYKKFNVLTDNAAVLHWSTMKDPGATMLRWLEVISQYDFEIRHIAGTKMLADPISRLPNLDMIPEQDDQSTAQDVQRFALPWENQVQTIAVLRPQLTLDQVPADTAPWEQSRLSVCQRQDPILQQVHEWILQGKWENVAMWEGLIILWLVL